MMQMEWVTDQKPKENGTYIVTQEIHSLSTGEFMKTEVTTAQFDAAHGKMVKGKAFKGGRMDEISGSV